MSRIGAQTGFSSQLNQFTVQLNLSPQVSKVKCEVSQDGVNWTFFSGFIPQNQFPLIRVPKNLKDHLLMVTGLDANETPVCQATSSIQELMSNTILVLSSPD